MSGHVHIKILQNTSRYETRLGTCPLLMQPENYIADTVDLTRDHEARDYWLACFEDSLPKVRF